MASLLVPTTAFAVALAPAVVAPHPVAPAALPVVQVEEIQLAGIGQDIYNAITPIVQTVVGDVSYLINFIPILGRIAAAQINITYFQGLQPSVAATVNYAAALIADPLNLFPITGAYVDTLVGIGRDVVSAELRWLGFNELPPRPTAGQGPRLAAAGRKATVQAPTALVAESAAPTADRTAKRLSRTHARAAAHQGRKSGETRRLKSTTGRSRSAI